MLILFKPYFIDMFFGAGGRVGDCRDKEQGYKEGKRNTGRGRITNKETSFMKFIITTFTCRC